MNRLEGLRNIIKVGSVLTLVGSAAFPVACNNEGLSPTAVNRSEVPKTLTFEFPQTDWDKLPALSRLKMLRKNSYPKVEWFDVQKEHTKAAVEFLCQNVKCNLPINDIINSFVYVNQESIAEKIREKGFDLNEEKLKQRENALSFILESPDKTNKIIVVKTDVIKTTAEQLVARQPVLNQTYVFENILRETAVGHEAIHLINPDDEISLKKPFMHENISFYKLHGFLVVGNDMAKREVVFGGIDEAITELTAQIIRKRSGFGLESSVYGGGVGILSKLVSSVGISDDEYLKYIDGRRSISERLERIGSFKKNPSYNKQAVGVNALFEIGLLTYLYVDEQTTINYLNSILNVKIK